MNSSNVIPLANPRRLMSVVGPQERTIHYSYDIPGNTLCGMSIGRSWRETDDQFNNASRYGFCERCIRRAANGF